MSGQIPIKEAELICLSRPDGDLNGDCKVDFRDFAELAGNWLK